MGRATVLLALLALAACGGDVDPGDGRPSRAGAHEARATGRPAPAGNAWFEDVTAAAGIDHRHAVADGAMDSMLESVGAGAAWLDADGDGHLDLYLIDQGHHRLVSRAPAEGGEAPARGAGNRLLRNRGDGTFEDVTARAGVGMTGFCFAAAAADYDADGDTDLYVLALGPNRLFRNRGDGTFEDVTAHAGVAGDACSVAGTFLDADGDGDLDLYVGNYITYDPSYRLHYAPDGFPGPLAFEAQADVLYRNRGDGTFEDATAAVGMDVAAARTMGVLAADLDGDGAAEVFTANDLTPNHCFTRRPGETRFREIARESGLAFGFSGEATGAMAAQAGDYDGDGLLDLHVTDTSYGSLYRNLGNGAFTDRARATGVARASGPWVSWGGGFLDADRDGDLDLYVVNGDLHHATGRPDLLLENRDGVFEDVSPQAGAWFRAEETGRAGALADYDDDGDLDVLVTHVGGRARLLQCNPPDGGHWIGLVLRTGRGLDAALGARVTIRTQDRVHVRTLHVASGYLSQADPRLLVGLGRRGAVDDVRVRWPGGREERFGRLAPDRYHVLREGEGSP